MKRILPDTAEWHGRREDDREARIAFHAARIRDNEGWDRPDPDERGPGRPRKGR